jgi:hypothetical protein
LGYIGYNKCKISPRMFDALLVLAVLVALYHGKNAMTL